ncbi:MAG: RNA polymerase sigma factor [Saprospiraceae bacterium]|nr:RNA polymerase sigma factor [Lewinella sp.]
MDQHSKAEFQQIIQGCRRQDRSSQNALYRLFYPYGMSICIRYTGSESEAISMLNDGFLKVFRHIKQYDTQQPFKPWFRRIVINTAINQIKKDKKFKMEVRMEEAKHLPSEEDILSRIGYKELMEMVQSLSAAYRTVFNMYVIDGFKHQEIADSLGISIATSKSNLVRARARLKEMLAVKLSDPHV